MQFDFAFLGGSMASVVGEKAFIGSGTVAVVCPRKSLPVHDIWRGPMPGTCTRDSRVSLTFTS